MPFVNSSGPIPGMDFGFPDVCNTPLGPVVTPIPYPNFTRHTDTIQSADHVHAGA
jgi:hypothetical protein